MTARCLHSESTCATRATSCGEVKEVLVDTSAGDSSVGVLHSMQGVKYHTLGGGGGGYLTFLSAGRNRTLSN